MNLVIVIPAYNEEKVIGEVLRAIPFAIHGIDLIQTVVVDDHSKDKTKDEAELNGAKCVRHRMNLGAGGATVTGFKMARKLNADLVVTMDGDGQHDAADLPLMLKPLLENRADVVIGSRLMDVTGMPFIKVFGNHVMNFFTKLLTGVKTSDSQSGFRAYNKVALTKIDLKTFGYEVCTEIFSEIKTHKLRFVEVPIKVIYTEHSRLKGQSVVNGVNIIFKMITRNIAR